MAGNKQRTTDDGTLSSWLDRLQRESWELELLISGFSIFLLLGGYGPYVQLIYYLDILTDESASYVGIQIAYHVTQVAYLALIVSLILHVILRGMWVAAIGLRSVSGGIDYRSLRYRPVFRRWLSRSVGSFDRYIERLERYCSVLFAVAFLLLFCFLSLTSYFLITILLKAVIGWVLNMQVWGSGVFGNNGVVDLIMLGLGVIYLLDFATLGLLKRSRWTARVYYPVYRLMGWITLSWLYRPLYHNLIDNRFGRRIAWFIPLLVLGFVSVASLRVITDSYFPFYFTDGVGMVDHYNYDDTGRDLLYQRWRVTLNSRYPVNNYVEVFVPYRPRRDDPTIHRLFPTLQPARYTGIKMDGGIKIGAKYNPDASNDSLVTALSALSRLYLNDSLRPDIAARAYYHHERSQAGVLYMVPTHELPVGEHHVRVDRRRVYKDSLYWNDGGLIYFYK